MNKNRENKVWIHSAKKFCDVIDKLPEDAVFWKESTFSVPVNIIAKEERKDKTVFHVHKKNGSVTYKGKHLVYKIDRKD